MAFTQKELEILKLAKENGLNRQQAEESIKNYRLGIKPNQGNQSGLVYANQKKSGLETIKDYAVGAGKGFLEGAVGLGRLAVNVPETIGQGIVAGLDPTRTFEEVRADESVGKLLGLSGKDASDFDEALKAQTPEERAGKVLGLVGEVLGTGGVGGVRRGLTKGAEIVGETARSLGQRGLGVVPTGIKQVGQEFVERVPRFTRSIREGIESTAQRAERIKSSTPAVQNAIKSNVDDKIINFVDEIKVQQPQALKDMKQIVDLAESAGKRGVSRPEFIAGQRASEQYQLANNARKDVGKKIGEVIDSLSTQKGKIDTLPEIRQFRILLSENGINPTPTGKLLFETTQYTKQQQKAIQELYDIVNRGEALTPSQIWGFDRHFSQLKRNARFDNQIGDVYIKSGGNDVNLYDAFRNVYANKLEQIAPEIKDLNREYAYWKKLIDDVEDSIVKRGNFSGNANIDSAEFAQTNLRRLFSDATSAADYRAIYNRLDEAARQLGYEGARADDLAEWATLMRRTFPESIPETSVSKIFSGGLRGIPEKILEIGKPKVKDQQKAIKEMLDEALNLLNE